MKEFNTAIREAIEDQDAPLEFAIDGAKMVAYKPTDGQIAITMAAMSRHTSDQTKAAAAIDFFIAVLDEDSAAHITERLMTREDPFGLEEVQDILEFLVEEWIGRPTQPPSGSTRSPKSGGQKSRPRTTKSTSSTSARASS